MIICPAHKKEKKKCKYLPESNNAVNGASTLNGCTPVNLINRGSLGTCESGVPRSISKTFVGLIDGGGSGTSTS